MKIRVEQKLKPFSFYKGGYVPLPGSFLFFQIFPTEVTVFSLEGIAIKLFFPIQGPFSIFLYQVDLDKKRIEVSLRNETGFYSYHLFIEKGELVFFLDRGPSFLVRENKKERVVQKKERISWNLSLKEECSFEEKLSFGSYKKQEIEKILYRKDPKELFPFWFHLGGLCPKIEEQVSIFPEWEKAILERKGSFLLQRLALLWEVAFSGFFIPSSEDKTKQNIPFFPEKEKVHPYFYLQAGARCIRSFFLQEEKGVLKLLPSLPKEFPFGRIKGVNTLFGKIDLEWSKFKPKKGILYVEKEGPLLILSGFSRFRVRSKKRERGTFHLSSDALFLKKGQILYLDRFEK